MKTSVFKGAVLISMLAALLMSLPASADPAFSGIVAFGTSLSDPGNDFAMRGVAIVPPYDTLDPLLVPNDPYAKGGHHVSNGATWIEHLGRSLALAGSVRPAFGSSNTNATNYAVKGARAYDNKIDVNLSKQAAAFLQDRGNVAPSDALYAIEIGANDVRDAAYIYSTGGDIGPLFNESLTTVAGTIQTLYAAGARKFLVWRLPNIGLTPASRMLGPDAMMLMAYLTESYNTALDGVAAMLAALPGIEIRRLDAYQILNNIIADPAAYGISVVDSACVTPNIAPFECQNPDEYVFWDGIHPTTAVHAIIAHEAAVVLQQ
jgi:phospholipase/lecithinase/hemolysin